MRLTLFTDYSVRVLLYVAVAPGGRATIGEVAKAFDVSENHLTKVVHLLGREGFLVNTRGRGGGLALGAVPQAINIGRVVRATEGSEVAECFAGTDDCTIASACRFRSMLGEAVEAFYATLDRYSLADLVENPRRLSAIVMRDSSRRPSTGT